MSRVLGLDVGGAFLKAALSDGVARTLPFALWREPQRLHERLLKLAEGWDFDSVSLTMTAELCDCFPKKSEGVISILTAVESAFPGRRLETWTLDARLAHADEVRARPLVAAAANWLALATWAGRLAPHGTAVLIDIGSTTTDIVPLRDGRPVPNEFTDAGRMRYGELIYTGVRRTPLCAIAGFSVMAELFATTLDVYLYLGLVKPDPTDFNTADGRPADREHARARLARILGGDLESADESSIAELCHEVHNRQRDFISSRASRTLDGDGSATVITSGSGEFLAKEVAASLTARAPVSLTAHLGPAISSAACAYAVSILAHEAWN